MYWFRHTSILGFLPWILTTAIWFVGGWLIAIHAFDLKKHERLIIGFGIGMVIYLWLINLLGRWLPNNISFYVPALLTLAIGVIYSKFSKNKLADLSDFQIWPVLMIWAMVFVYSLFLERGLMIFDDVFHLSSISLMGAGKIPPLFFLNGNFDYAYHYGFDILGASLMRLGDMFAWSAFDFSKAIAWSYSIILLGLVFYRFIKSTWKAILGAFVFTFLSGTRYLLMLLPANFLQQFDSQIGFIGISTTMNTTFSKSLFMQWSGLPNPPQPYLFGFINGIYSSYHFFHTGEWPLALIIIYILWLVSSKPISWKILPLLVILWSHLALTSESCYGLLIAAFALFFLFYKVIKKGIFPKSFNILLSALIISLPFAFLQGGAIFEIIMNVFRKIFSVQPNLVSDSNVATMFSINWPPKIILTTFTDLDLFNPAHLFVAILEIGPILFFVPMLIRRFLTKANTDQWMTGLLAFCTLIGFFIPLFISFDLIRNVITRFAAFAMIFWFILFLLLILGPENTLGKFMKTIAIISVILMSISGIVNFSTQLSAIPKPVLSEHLVSLDAQISSKVWGSLSQKDFVYDPDNVPGRAVELIGIATIARPGLYTNEMSLLLPSWEDLYQNPSIAGFQKNNFRYVYLDEKWWSGMTDGQKDSLSNPCVKVVAEASADNEFRKLLDLEKCAPTS